MSQYSFGDSELARERLALVADTFESPTRVFLGDLPPTLGRYIIDVGCGPGFTTEVLHDVFPLAQITGFDASDTMIADARTRVPYATFATYDVTRPLLLPADLVYSRLLLGHLRDPAAAMAVWAASLRPGSGLLACEEPVRYRSDDAYFRRYEVAVTTIVTETGARLWASNSFDQDPPGCERVLDRVVEHPVPASRAAGMFWRNAMQWRERVPDADELIAHFRTQERHEDATTVMWELRQVAFRRRRA